MAAVAFNYKELSKPVRFIVLEGGASQNIDTSVKKAHLDTDCQAKVTSEVISRSKLSLYQVAKRVIIASLLIATVLSIFDSFSYASSMTAVSSAPTKLIHVAEGDSLWSIAQRCGYETSDTQVAVNYIQQINHLENTHLSIGQALTVPLNVNYR